MDFQLFRYCLARDNKDSALYIVAENCLEKIQKIFENRLEIENYFMGKLYFLLFIFCVLNLKLAVFQKGFLFNRFNSRGIDIQTSFIYKY